MSWRIGASTDCCPDQPLEPVIDALAAGGVTGVELGAPRYFAPWRRDQADALRARLAAAGVSAVSVHAPFGGALDLSDSNGHHRSAAIGAILDAAAVLKALGGAIVVVHPSDVPRGADAASRLAHAADSLRQLHESCAAIGVTLAIETPLPHLVGGAVDEFDWLIGRIGPDARVCIDTGHATLGGQWDAFIGAVGRRIVHVHAADHFGREDDHLAPGDGTIDWAHIGASLQKIRYLGWLMLELRCTLPDVTACVLRAASSLEQRLNHQPQ
jgi:sugar phosphate isomerase/epimerase